MQIHELKERYRIPHAWRDLGLPGEPGEACRSPFPHEHKHGDENPSFSVYEEGRRWTNHATGEHGDVIDLIKKARQCTVAEAIAFLEERMGIARTKPNGGPDKPKWSRIPPLRAGQDQELRQLAEGRGFAVEALKIAQERGFLHFGELWGNRAWCITDSRRQLFEFRRLDGQPWPAYGRLAARKCHCFGKGKNWPIGTLESKPFQKVAWVEGAPDFLAVFHFLLVEGKAGTVAPVGILGASNRQLEPEALACFRNKTVCLYPHVDPVGRNASRSWAIQVKNAGAAQVVAFDLSGLVTANGAEGKDLADVCKIDAGCFEQERKFQEVLP